MTNKRNLNKNCDTCTKKTPAGKRCRVLKEMIGKNEECWAWSDDPDWEKKVKKAVQEYALGRNEEG
jgi:hypothetical protein